LAAGKWLVTDIWWLGQQRLCHHFNWRRYRYTVISSGGSIVMTQNIKIECERESRDLAEKYR
jgi:hypothetical protein